MRIGHGYDIHRFVEDKPLMLGGVHIPFSQGMLGHSDGDVVLHAICDALLGAAGLGDIGEHFSDKNPKFKNIASQHLLTHTLGLIKEKNLQVANIDVSIIAEVPKLSPHKKTMRETIANLVGIEASYVNIKATTMEGLGPIGHQEAIAVHAVVLLNEGI